MPYYFYTYIPRKTLWGGYQKRQNAEKSHRLEKDHSPGVIFYKRSWQE